MTKLKNELSGISKRFLEVIDKKCPVNKEIIKLTNIITPAKLTNIKSGRDKKPSWTLIEELLNIFPDTNESWLLTGNSDEDNERYKNKIERLEKEKENMQIAIDGLLHRLQQYEPKTKRDAC